MAGASSRTLWKLWRANRCECRSVGSIMEDAHAGRLPGIKPDPSGFGFEVTDSKAALKAMRRADA